MSRQEFPCPEEDRVIKPSRPVFWPYHMNLCRSQETPIGGYTSIFHSSPYLPVVPSLSYISYSGCFGLPTQKSVSKMSGPKESSNDGPADVLIGWQGSIPGHVTLSDFRIDHNETALFLWIRPKGWAASFCSSPLPFYPFNSFTI